jgi:hypothetical protein
MTISIQDFVKREVIYCVSALIHSLTDYETCPAFAEQAQRLFESDPNFERAARGEGWQFDANKQTFYRDKEIEPAAEDWEDLCLWQNIEPHCPEILEHWIVSEQLARKLQAKGERVSLDFQGLIIWGRSQNDQEIFMDDVIQDIYSEMVPVSQ